MKALHSLLLATFVFAAGASFSVKAWDPDCFHCEDLFWQCLTSNPDFWDQCELKKKKCQLAAGCPVDP